jgi:hypothetical protein
MKLLSAGTTLADRPVTVFQCGNLLSASHAIRGFDPYAPSHDWLARTPTQDELSFSSAHVYVRTNHHGDEASWTCDDVAPTDAPQSKCCFMSKCICIRCAAVRRDTPTFLRGPSLLLCLAA